MCPTMPVLKSGLDTAGKKAKMLEVVLDPEKATEGPVPCHWKCDENTRSSVVGGRNALQFSVLNKM